MRIACLSAEAAEICARLGAWDDVYSNILLQPGPRILEGAQVLHDLFKDWRQSRVEALAT